MQSAARCFGLPATLAVGVALTLGTIAPAAGTTAESSAHQLSAARPVPVPAAGRAASTRHPDHIVGHGTPASCTSSAFVKAVAKGGVITFDCGPKHTTITLRATARVTNTSKRVVIDGGGRVTLSGGGTRRILYMNTCDASRVITNTSDCYAVAYPHLVVQNITMRDGYSASKVSVDGSYPAGGGAVFSLGGSLKVVNSRFIDNRCYRVGPDLGGGAIRAIVQYNKPPVYITHDTFRGGRCSNGGALSSIATSWVVTNSVFTNNVAIGHGQNPKEPGTPGGGSGGAIYMDGNAIALTVKGSTFTDNRAKEGAGAIFFVSDDNSGTLTIGNSTLHNNPSGTFYTRAYPGIFYHSSGQPTITNSTIN
jgi:hypothetical protein